MNQQLTEKVNTLSSLNSDLKNYQNKIDRKTEEEKIIDNNEKGD